MDSIPNISFKVENEDGDYISNKKVIKTEAITDSYEKMLRINGSAKSSNNCDTPTNVILKNDADTEITNFRADLLLQEVIEGQKRYVCYVCNKVFQRRYRFLDHFRTHTQEKPFSCAECGKKFSSKTLKQKHESVHLEKQYICEICAKNFSRKEHLTRHLKQHSGAISRFPCSDCGQLFSTKAHLKYHYLKHENITSIEHKTWPCPACNMRFPVPSQLKYHLRSHTGEKPHTCMDCGKSYTRNQHLKTHMLVHTGVKPYKCEICYRGFTEAGKLKKHLRTHTGEKPYECTKCGRNFTTNYNCRVHMRIHDRNPEQSMEIIKQSSEINQLLQNT